VRAELYDKSCPVCGFVVKNVLPLTARIGTGGVSLRNIDN